MEATTDTARHQAIAVGSMLATLLIAVVVASASLLWGVDTSTQQHCPHMCFNNTAVLDTSTITDLRNDLPTHITTAATRLADAAQWVVVLEGDGSLSLEPAPTN